jgi:hypothetical protein
MRNWSDFHSDPRKSYYLFLRQGYGCPAREAHARLKRVDGMVLMLQTGLPGPSSPAGVTPFAYLRRAANACSTSVQRVWGSFGPNGRTCQTKARRAISSKFFHST